MKKQLIIFLILLIFPVLIYGQEKLTVSILVVDQETQHPILNAHVKIDAINLHSISDSLGRCKFELIPNYYFIEITHLAYQSFKKEFRFKDQTDIVFGLTPANIDLEEVEINSTKNTKKQAIGSIHLDQKSLENTPMLLGSSDILKSFQLSSGVQSAGEGDIGIYVRGGDAGQNLFLLDRMPLFNPSHLLGMYPAINSTALQGGTLFKGSAPSKYGGKISSVIDMTLQEGSKDKIEGNLSVGLLSTDLFVSTPLFTPKVRLALSGRAADILLLKNLGSKFNKDSTNLFFNSDYNFHDGTIRLDLDLSKQTRIWFTGFLGSDDFLIKDKTFLFTHHLTWRNQAYAGHILHYFSPNFSLSLHSGNTQYNYHFGSNLNMYDFQMDSKVSQDFLNLDFVYVQSGSVMYQFGAQYLRNDLIPNNVNVNVESVNFQNNNQLFGDELSCYVSSAFSPQEKLNFEIGLRYGYYRQLGPYTNSNENDRAAKFEKNEKVASYHTIDPKFNFNYSINRNEAIKGAISVNHQFIHLASIGSVSLPTDIWLPTSDFLPPQLGIQYSGGYYKTISKQNLEFAAEIYLKNLWHQIEFKNALIDNVNFDLIQENLLFGKGRSYGLELQCKKTNGVLTGAVHYTLSRTVRIFEALNQGNPFPAKYDRTHDLTLQMAYHKNEHWQFSLLSVFATGNAFTLPSSKYIIEGTIVNNYSSINGFRMPPYHRLDLSATYNFTVADRLESKLIFSVYNVYNRHNPYYIYYTASGDLSEYNLNVEANQISLFPILPSITYKVKF